MPQIDALRFAFTGQLMLSGRQWRQISQAAVTAHGISAAAAAPLLFIRRLGGGVRQVTLADYVGVEGATLVRLVDQLCAADLVRREVDPSDRRANVLSLTEAGERMAERIEVELKQLRAEVFADVSEADMAAALRVLDALSRAAAAASASGKQES
ncbi:MULTISPECIES: MarR family winged helix-turn-helix transcriptional regulator [unclassified Cupriavidus]|jgi:MarR family transcriptional regulator for hemolysin|uniref:MarR family winged helix-turn-helix transcriptional regulator n=1 Tax=unclassified Cupriavidus TaxID=2640874 RepID=UPI001C002B90|nr:MULTISPECIES: MarR family winged helix-turn-helix transcriptional regulator [unclassified Cupriavidus]MCA3182762.1 winged helix-turn-helix transcriptional regulator [Cupriavidus sp.]MCA3191627.1 winged helix-turn-helix transcriptional regulator [Cupriavidus sp.]MCA3199778.1 winged helix-turn-helix transcriptional regulator [Cupriavidus sp.]MCA3205486.1 winged helix-turn-helix transcriptional regulator [Cupriavidus sp.]MCA3206108.1 winged helix-turn-helix transcriptional regulator [Cupriavid